MRLAAAERGLQPDDRIAAGAGEPLQHSAQNPLQAFGQEGDAEEAFRRRIVLRCRAGVDGEEIGGELASLKRLASTSGCGSATSIQGLSALAEVSSASRARLAASEQDAAPRRPRPDAGTANPECRCAS